MSIPDFLLRCQQATLLVEQRADAGLPIIPRLQLWAHLRLCPYCRRYAFQSPYLARQARLAAGARVPADVRLPAAARARLERVVAAHGGTVG